MLFLTTYELWEGENSYSEHKFLEADNPDDAGRIAEDYLYKYFGDETDIWPNGGVFHKRGFPGVKLGSIIPVEFEDVIDRLGYIGEKKPELDKHLFCILESDIDSVLEEMKQDYSEELTSEQRDTLISVVSQWEYSDTYDSILQDAKDILAMAKPE